MPSRSRHQHCRSKGRAESCSCSTTFKTRALADHSYPRSHFTRARIAKLQPRPVPTWSESALFPGIAKNSLESEGRRRWIRSREAHTSIHHTDNRAHPDYRLDFHRKSKSRSDGHEASQVQEVPLQSHHAQAAAPVTTSKESPELDQIDTGVDLGQDNECNLALPAAETEQYLRVKRRHLLARPDWLELSVARPLQMEFPSSRGKHRIAKRRIPSSATAHRRQSMRLPANEQFQTGAEAHGLSIGTEIDPGRVRVKIGTDALASQTQPSKRSLSLLMGNSSLYPCVPDEERLSQESMLLGPENDFAGVRDCARIDSRSPLSSRSRTPLLSYSHVRRHPQRESFSHSLRFPHAPYTQSPDGSSRTSIDDILLIRGLPQCTGSISETAEDENDKRQSSRPIQGATNYRHLSNASRSSKMSRTVEEGLKDDPLWRRLMNIAKESSGTTLSICSTASDVEDQRRTMKRPAESQLNAIPPVALPLPSLSLSDSRTPQVGQEKEQATDYPSQNNETANKSALNGGDDETEEAAIWRRFIFGSGRKTNDQNITCSDDILANVPFHSDGGGFDDFLRPMSPPSAAISGLGTSDEATMDDATWRERLSSPCPDHSSTELRSLNDRQGRKSLHHIRVRS